MTVEIKLQMRGLEPEVPRDFQAALDAASARRSAVVARYYSNGTLGSGSR